MTKACASWIALSDRAATGDELDQGELAFVESHAASCSACGVEASVWSALGQSLGDPSRLTATPEPAASVTPLRKRRFRSRLVATAAAAVLGFAGLAWFGGRGSTPGALPGPKALAGAIPNSRAGVRLVLVSGAVRVNGGLAVAGHQLALRDALQVEGTACFLVPPGVTVCADPETELTVVNLSATERRLQLTRGRVLARLEPQLPGASFGFETASGSVVATGTVFSVEARGSDVQLRVQEGTVVGSAGSRPQSFVGPTAALLSPTGGVAQLAFEASERDAHLFELSKLFTDRASGELEVTALSSGEVRLDDSLLGSTPVSAWLVPGSHRLVFEQRGTAPPVSERLVVKEGERAIRRYEAPPPASGSAETQATAPALANRAAAPGSAGSAAAAAALLAEARELRAAGRYVAAGSTYGRLQREYPGSAEARAALVSFGELQLSQLGDAAGALRSFDAYLRSAGSLAQEASYGKIRALRALGRRTEEQAATAAFLARYPKSVQATRLRSGRP